MSRRAEGQAQSAQSSSFGQPGTLVDVGTDYGSSVRLGSTQLLLRAAGRDVSRAALDQSEVALASARVARQRVASEVLQGALAAYWELYYASRAYDIDQQGLQLAERQRDEAAARVATGGVAPVELLTFESRVAALRKGLASAEAEQQSRATALGQAIGLPDGARELSAVAGDKPAATSDPVGDLRGAALGSSYRVLELREAVRLAEVQERTAAEPLRPRLDLTGYVQAQDQLRASSLRKLRARIDNTQLRLQILHLTGKLLEAHGASIRRASARIPGAPR